METNTRCTEENHTDRICINILHNCLFLINFATKTHKSSYTDNYTHLFSFSSIYSWSETSGNWTTLTLTGLELCKSLLTSWTLRS